MVQNKNNKEIKFNFLFREEEVSPRYWSIKEYIIKAYFAFCSFYHYEPDFNKEDPITKANFDIAIDLLTDAEVLA